MRGSIFGVEGYGWNWGNGGYVSIVKELNSKVEGGRGIVKVT